MFRLALITSFLRQNHKFAQFIHHVKAAFLVAESLHILLQTHHFFGESG